MKSFVFLRNTEAESSFSFSFCSDSEHSEPPHEELHHVAERCQERHLLTFIFPG